MIAPDQVLIPIRQWCRTRGVGPTKAYELLAEGRLTAVKVGAKTLITADSDREWQRSLPVFQPQHAS